MLKSIRKFDRKTREGILSDIALELGRPSFNGAFSLDYLSSEAEDDKQNIASYYELFQKTWNDPSDVRLLAVEEIIKSLNLKGIDQFHELKAKLLAFVGNEIRALALESKDISKARKRLGQKGMLSPKAYQVKFAQEFFKFCIPLGVTKNEVVQSIGSPDMFEHFLPEIEDCPEAISLYTKMFKNGADPYTLMVDSRRVGDELNVHFAARVYHSDVDLLAVNSAMDILQAFTDKYGWEITLGSQKGKLIKNFILNGAKFFQIETMHPVGKKTVYRYSFRRLTDDRIEFSIAYGVDIDLYAEALRSHGVAAVFHDH